MTDNRIILDVSDPEARQRERERRKEAVQVLTSQRLLNPRIHSAVENPETGDIAVYGERPLNSNNPQGRPFRLVLSKGEIERFLSTVGQGEEYENRVL